VDKKASQRRVSIWLDEDLLCAFEALHPIHGAFSHFVRVALRRHLQQLEKEIKILLPPEPSE